MKKTLLSLFALGLGACASINAMAAGDEPQKITVSRVEASATAIANLTSSKYVIKVSSDKNGNTTGSNFSNAQYLYAGDDNKPHTGQESNFDLSGTIPESKYVWNVTVAENNQIILQSVSRNQYLQVGTSNNEGISLTSTSAAYTIAAYDEQTEWGYMYNTPDGSSSKFYLCNYGSKNQINGLNTWDYSSSNPTEKKDIARLQFFAVKDVNVDAYDIVYNYKAGDKVIYSQHTLTPVNTSFPDLASAEFVTVNGTKPAGTVTAEGTHTYDIAIDLSNYPVQFTTSESDAPIYGFLLCNISTTDRNIFYDGGNGIAKRAATDGKYAVSTLNAVNDELWSIVGNPFEGFKFINKKANHCFVKRSNSNGANLAAASTTASDNLWKIFDNNPEDESKVTDADKATLLTRAFTIRHANAAEGNYYLESNLSPWQKNSNGCTWLFEAPEFPVSLHENGGAYYATLCLPFDVKIKDAESATAYVAESIKGNTLNMTSVGGIGANKGVVVVGNSATVILTANDVTAATTTNVLTGTTQEVTDVTDKLVFGVSTTANTVGFYTLATGKTIPANCAYLNKSELPSDVQAVAMNFNGTTTAINGVVNGKAAANAPIFDLSGRRVAKMVKNGLYIQNGKKIIAQ